MPLSPGDQLGPYEIVAPIGAGGMGEVYRARDAKLNRDVAIKMLPPELAADAQYMARFEREARMLAALNHPNIATVYGIEQGALVMELVEGDDLKGPLPLDEALAIARQIAAGLEAAHEKGIIHRDLKPANIKLTPGGVVKILDFGLAKASGEVKAASGSSAADSPTLSLEMTRAGMILGTAAYMAPEQAKGKPVDKRADIWAFGVVLYEIVTGKRLFEGEDLTETLASVVRDQPDLSGVPPKFRRLLERCLEKDPKKRLRDIADIELLLLAESPAPAAPAPKPRTARLPWIVPAVVAAGLAAALVPHLREKPPALMKFVILPPENGKIQGRAGTVAVSPDGRRIVFGVRRATETALWVRDLDSLDARMLPGTEDARFPFWAPDSRRLGFHSNGKLMRIDVTGGTATPICTTSLAGGADWNQDDVIIFGVLGSGLLRVSASGGVPSPLTVLDQSRNEGSHFLPQFLPDRHHFLYFGQSGDPEKSGIFVGDLNSKDNKLLFPSINNARYAEPAGGAFGEDGHLLFLRERALMAQRFDTGKLELWGDAVPVANHVDVPITYGGYFGTSRNGVLAYASGAALESLQMTWYDRSGKVVGTLGKPVDVLSTRISPTGKMVAADRVDPRTGRREIWLYDLERGVEQRLAFGEVNLQAPVWSPDSLRVAYYRAAGSTGAILVKSADGARQEEVLAPSLSNSPKDWTRDGAYLISATSIFNPRTGQDLWAFPLSDGKLAGKSLPLRQTTFAEDQGRVSPDGRWLAYQSNQSGRAEVYIAGFPTMDGNWQVSVDGGRSPVWSRDGRELYFVGATSNTRMMAVEIKPGPQFQASVPKPLFDVRLTDMGQLFNPGYDVSADGRFLIPTPVERGSAVPLTVLLNWQAALKQ